MRIRSAGRPSAPAAASTGHACVPAYASGSPQAELEQPRTPRDQRLEELESRSTLRVAWGRARWPAARASDAHGSVAAAAEGARSVLVRRLRVRYRPDCPA